MNRWQMARHDLRLLNPRFQRAWVRTWIDIFTLDAHQNGLPDLARLGRDRMPFLLALQTAMNERRVPARHLWTTDRPLLFVLAAGGRLPVIHQALPSIIDHITLITLLDDQRLKTVAERIERPMDVAGEPGAHIEFWRPS